MLLQFLSVLDNINIPYTGYPKESYNFEFMYYIGIVFFYIGYFIWSLIALALVYIPIFIKNKKEQNNNSNLQDSNKDDEDLNSLINKLEKNQKN